MRTHYIIKLLLSILAAAVAVAPINPAQSAPGLSDLFAGKPPRVVVNQGEAKLFDEDENPLPCYLSVQDNVAVTINKIREANFVINGELLIWDLSQGRLRHRIEFPARITALAGRRGSGRIVVGGGPLGKDFNPPFLHLVDLDSGEIVAEWKAQHSYGGNLSLRVTGDDRFAAVQEGGVYNRSTRREETRFMVYPMPGKGGKPAAASPINEATWNRLPKPGHETAPAMTSAPNWITRVGDSDAGFALAADRNGTALWRTDTWEQVDNLGNFSEPWQDWAPSPDGRYLMSWRDNVAGGLTIWDLSSFRVESFDEPDFHRGISPSFSADNRFLRYARVDPESGAVEIVSRDIATGHSEVARRFPSQRFENFYETGFRAVFSENGRHLLVNPGTGARPTLISWSLDGNPTVTTTAVSGGHPVFVSDDGKGGSLLGERIEKGNKVIHPVAAFDLKTGRKFHSWTIANAGHTPQVSGASDLATGHLAYCQHTTGASLGYYSGDAVAIGREKGWRIPGFQVSEDQHPTDRFGHAWSVSFVNSPGANSRLVSVFANLGRFVTFDMSRQKIVHDYRWDDYASGIYDPDQKFPLMKKVVASEGSRAFLPLRRGGIRVIDLGEGGKVNHRADLWSLPGNGWFAVTPDGYYASSVGSQRHVYFQLGEEFHSFDQFDAVLNRPGLVAAALGTEESEVEALRRAHRRRLAALGFASGAVVTAPADAPRLEIRGKVPLTHDEDSLSIELGGGAMKGRTIRSLEVVANGVPLDLAAANQVSGASSFGKQISIPLAPGPNLLQFSLLASDGSKSVARSARVHRKAGGNKPDLYLVMIGVSDYRNDAYDLSFPAKDARDLAAALTKSAVGFAKVHHREILDTRATREGILAARSFLRQSNPGDRTIVFLAGHGLLDEKYRYFFATTDIDAGNPADRGLSYEQIESIFEGVPARERLVLMDTCQAGGVDIALLETMEKSGKGLPEGVRAVSNPVARAAPAITPETSLGRQRFVEELFTDLNRGTGATVISASGGLEFAVESNEWNNGVFTYSVIRAIDDITRGDRDRDGILSASELVDAVSGDVVRLTQGLQHPNARSVNPAIDFPVVGRQEVVRLEEPLDFLKRYLRMSASHVEQPATDPRIVVRLFADRVHYFGKVLGKTEILRDIEEYTGKFDERIYEIKGPVRENKARDGSVTMDYEMAFRAGFFENVTVNIPGRGPTPSKSRAYRRGNLKMRMKLVNTGSEWKITALGTR